MGGKWIAKWREMPVQVRASFCFLVCSLLQRGISTITTPIFTRLLSPEEYGQFCVFNSWMGIVTIFVTLQLSMGVYAQGLVKFENERREFSSSLQGLTLTLCAGWAAVYWAFRAEWNALFSLSTVQMLAMLVIIWSSAAFGFWASEQRVMYKYKTLVAVTLAESVAAPALGIFFVLHAEDRVTARILSVALVQLFAYSAFCALQLWRGKRFYSARFWRYAVGFNLPLIPHYLSQVVLNSTDRIMIEDMVGVGEAGIYSLAYSLALIMTLFNGAVMDTMSPWMYRKIKERREKDIAPLAYTALAAVAGVNLFLMLLAPEAVAFFAPPAYYEAIYVIPPVAMSVYFMFMYDLYAKFAFYYERTWFIMAASVAGAVLNIVLNYIFIGLFGYMAAGYTTLACYIVYCIGHYLFMHRVCDECCGGVRPYRLRRILEITAALMASGFVLLSVYGNQTLRYGLIATVFVAALLGRKKLWQTARRVREKLKGTPTGK